MTSLPPPPETNLNAPLAIEEGQEDELSDNKLHAKDKFIYFLAIDIFILLVVITFFIFWVLTQGN